jgi:hypothetical protein
MDTTTLKNELLKFADALAHKGRTLDFLGIAPIFPEFPSTSYVLQVHGMWLDMIDSGYESGKIVIDELFASVSKDALRRINRVDVCANNSDIRCTQPNTIINTMNYELPTTLYEFAE